MINQEPAGESIDLFRLASRWRSGAEWKKIVEEMDSEPVPSHLNTINSSGLFQIVSTDKMSVQYVGTPQHGHDVGVVQADCPAPTRRLVYYFEMTVKNAGQKGQVAIGFTMQHFKMRRQPGYLVTVNFGKKPFLFDIEYDKVGQLAEAVSYAQSELQKFFSVKSYVDLLQDVSGLLAYKVPVESSVGYLLDGPQREFVADAVNAVVLSTNPNMKDPDRCLYSCLEKLLRQLTLCSLERRASREDQGETFCLHRELQSGGRAKCSS
ncbi:hypothetical protein BHE74_00004790 [Ensete ventricosum]|nr:hypothetical protein BHE74_00004790 [Ensete ventricosum]